MKKACNATEQQFNIIPQEYDILNTPTLEQYIILIKTQFTLKNSEHYELVYNYKGM